jgi:hypothetical protein
VDPGEHPHGRADLVGERGVAQGDENGAHDRIPARSE